MKNAELKGKGLDELNVILGNYKKELFNLRFQRATGVLGDTSRVSIIRKTIARIKTLMNSLSSLMNGGKNA